jgi:hypothetical protein
MLLANDGLLSITTIPAKPTMESFSPVLPSGLRGIASMFLISSAFANGVSTPAELSNPVAVPPSRTHVVA